MTQAGPGAEVVAAGGGIAADGVDVDEVTTLDDEWYDIRRYRLRAGAVGFTRVVCRRGDRAAVLPYSPARRTVLLTRQLRLPVLVNGDAGGVVVEAAGGLLDGRPPAEAAARELAEETGRSARDLREVAVVYLNPALVAERTHLFLAELLDEPAGDAGDAGAGRHGADEGEEVEACELALHEALAMARRGEIVDAKTVLLLWHLALDRGVFGAGPGEGSPWR